MQKTAPVPGAFCATGFVFVQLCCQGVCLEANTVSLRGGCGRAAVQWSRWRKRPQELRGWVKIINGLPNGV